MDPKYYRALELDKILARLAAHASFSASEQLALALIPSTDAAEIARRQSETSEATRLLEQSSDIGVGGARDVRPLTRNARVSAVLTATDLQEVRQTLLSARSLRRSLGRLEAVYPHLAARAALLADLPVITDAVGRAVNDRGEIADTASDALARIRHELFVLRGRLMDKLQKIITGPTYAKIIQEPIITQREGRYVIPVRAEAKGRLAGIVHDTSASGATLFLEPIGVVEMGNHVRELEREEEREIERILRELTALVGAHADAIDATVETLAEIDLAFAKAKYSAEIRGTAPNFEFQNSKFDLKDARHPLLDPTRVVPISIALGAEYTILVITGPNTGGKTVTLKTVGLLSLMAQCGLHIPAREGSRLPVFSGIYADIGDEQSIEQSLSTFSSHMKNLVEILRTADSHSLVLLDELGAGTDPVEGSALARAILNFLLDHKIPALVATHYAELKAFAHTTPGVQNASMEFDVETLSPTFHLTVGLPGRSNAFAIASRLGLDRGIIDDARATMSRGDVEMETMLAEIRRARQEAVSAQAHAELKRQEAERHASDMRRRLSDADKQRAEILEQAHADAKAEIELAREELNRLRQEWRSVSITRDFIENQADKLDRLASQLPAPESKPQRRPESLPSVAGTGAEPLRVGDQVWVEKLGKKGEIVALDGDGADVQIGSFRLHLKLDELGERVEKARPLVSNEPVRVSVPQVESPGVEVSLRGMRAADALEKLDKYLDRAYMAGLPSVRVVHGKGTGTLRRLARELLSEHPLVAEIRDGQPREGGEGVTIAKLVSR